MNDSADYTTAALRAAETLIRYGICTAPIDPLPILKKQPGIVIIPFAEMAFATGEDRDSSWRPSENPRTRRRCLRW